MTALLSDWGSRLLATPLTLGCVAIAVVAWLFAARAMWRRMPGATWRLAWGVAALGYLFSMVAFIAPPPERRTAVVPVLVTEGVSPEALASIPGVADVLVMGAAWRAPAVADWVRRRVAVSAAGRSVRISSVDDLVLHGTVPRRIRVIGDGLDAETWASLRWQGGVEFAPATELAGIADARWSRVLEAGLPFEVEARTTAAVPDGAGFELRDAEGAPLASVPAGAGSLAGPRLPAGRHVLQLVLEREGSEIERLDLPVVVREPAPARVLVLQAAPSFEWRAIGRWLARAGAIVATRTRVSDARFRERFTGMPERPLTPVDAALLADFDLVIADGAALAMIGEAERQRLLDAGHGAGVLVLLHDAADVAALPDALRGVLDGDVAGESVYQLPGAADRLDTGLGRLALTFGDGAGEALVSDLAGVPVVARAAPASHVALSLVRDSYRLAAVGASDAHAGLWSAIVRELARPAPVRGARVRPRDSRAGERVRVCVPATAASAAITLRDGAGDAFDVDLVATPWRPAERCGWAWPAAPGWLTVWPQENDEDATALGAHWVAPAGHLTTARRLARIDATRLRSSADATSGSELPADAATMPRARFLAALLAFGLLVALSERLAAARHHGSRVRR